MQRINNQLLQKFTYLIIYVKISNAKQLEKLQNEKYKNVQETKQIKKVKKEIDKYNF